MRLRPLTLTTPKCLIPIYGVPLLDHWLAMLLASGIERVLINTHHLADAVRRHVRQSSWQDRIDLVHEQELLGTGGTILANRDYFGGRAFLVAHSDNLTWFDVGAFIARHDARPPKAMITLMTFETDTPQSCGIVEQGRGGHRYRLSRESRQPAGNAGKRRGLHLRAGGNRFYGGIGQAGSRYLHRSATAFSRPHDNLREPRVSPRYWHAGEPE